MSHDSIVHPAPHVLAVGRSHDRQSPIEWTTAPNLNDQRTRGRAIYVSGGRLEECATPAERAGFVGAEADGRNAYFRCMADVSMDEWRNHRSEFDEAW